MKSNHPSSIRGSFKETVNGFLGGIAFETTIPLLAGEFRYRCFSKRPYLFPLVGGVSGIVLGGVGYGLGWSEIPLGAVFLTTFTYLLSGINHPDGLADIVDGIVSGKDKAERTKAIKDVRLGVGGALGLVISVLLLFSIYTRLLSALSPEQIFGAIIGAEIIAKLSPLLTMVRGTAAHEGMGSAFTKNSTLAQGLAGSIIAGGVLWLLGGKFFLTGLGISLILSLGGKITGNKLIGGINGDLLGAVHEFGRLLGLIFFLFLYIRS